ncbi:MAG: ComEC/Rec2 family competence protein [Desulfovibrio sp.]|jgi:ComEC/Rec2-related protein|nr:ComEC/Rec2 family competence protein [Desulfovibrio sp.]
MPAARTKAIRDCKDSENTPSRLQFLLFSEVCLVCWLAGISAFREPAFGLLALVTVILLDLPRSRNAPRLCCLGAAFVAAFAWTGLRAPTAPEFPQWAAQASALREDARGELRPPHPVRIRAVVDSSVPLPGDRVRVVLSRLAPASSLQETQTGSRAPCDIYTGKAYWLWNRPAFAPLPGETLELTVRLLPLRGLHNPGLSDYEQRMHEQGVWLSVRSGGKSIAVAGSAHGGLPDPFEDPSAVSLRLSLSILREKARSLFYAALPRRAVEQAREQDAGAALPATPGRILTGAGLLPALIFGDRSLVSPRIADLFAGAALSHSLALSGMHLAFAVLAGAVCARLAGRCFPSLYLRLPRPTLTLLSALPFALLYLWLGQAPISLQRAACMLCAAALCSFLRRPRLILDSLCAALFFLMLWDPFALFELSLQLSAMCMACIALTLPGIMRLSEKLFPAGNTGEDMQAPSRVARLKRGAFVLAANSLCIQIVLMPLTLRAFGNAGLLFPLNLLWLPLLQGLVLPLSFAALGALCLDLPAVGAALLRLASLPCECLVELLERLDGAGLMPAPLLPRPHGLSMAAFWLLCLCLPRLIASWMERRRQARQRYAQGFSHGCAHGYAHGYAQNCSQNCSQRCAQSYSQNYSPNYAHNYAQGYEQKTGQAAALEHEPDQGTGVEPAHAQGGRHAQRDGRAQVSGRGGRPGRLSRTDIFLPACALAFLILPFVFLNRPAPGLTLSLLDVGQGQAVLLEWAALPGLKEPAAEAASRPSFGATEAARRLSFEARDLASGAFFGNAGRILVDGGGSNSEFFDTGRRIVAPLLTDNALPRLAAVVNSHPDADHLGGLPWILRHFSVGRIFGNGQIPQGALAVRIQDALRAGGDLRMETLRAGDVYEPAQDLRLEVLHPPSGAAGLSNDLSLVLRLLWRGRSLALICGDVGSEVLQKLMREGRDLSAQVLVLPHHGSKSAYAEGFYRAVNARAALVSCSFANVWGFPSRAVRDALRDMGTPLYSTAEHGMVRLHWSAPDAEPELSLTR